MKMGNPLGFTKKPVTFFISLTYIALFTALICVHHILPSAPASDSGYAGVNVTEAWQDLQTLSAAFHPYNSHRNDEVRNWLLSRIDDVFRTNNVDYEVSNPTGDRREGKTKLDDDAKKPGPAEPVVVFNDMMTNRTVTSPSTLGQALTVYYESTNIIIYLRGRGESRERWWLDKNGVPPNDRRAVLVNAHYDSVSTGYGATDDGVGVVTILQLLKHYTSPAHQPKRGLVLLLNNGEEDYLNGARAFVRHPISKIVDSFVNLEGAGAGGRAAMFRSTDAEVTEAYKRVPYPFGTSLSSDGFKNGLIRSQTDYVVFNEELGARGMDIAFIAPRARYHTQQDSAKYTSQDAIWHMLSAALETTKGLTGDMDTRYKAGEGSTAVYFDIFGLGFGLMKLQELFALSVTMLVVPPLVLFLTLLILSRLNRCYVFAVARITDPLDPHTPDEPTVVKIGGWKGYTRFPIAVVIASGVVVALAQGINQANPYIMYSAPYPTLALFMSSFFAVCWFFLRGSSFMRPTALQRAHTLGWLFVLSWAALVAATVGEADQHLGGSYPVPIFYAAVFVALELSYVELFFLPRIDKYVANQARLLARREESEEDDERIPRPITRDSEPNETTSLLSASRSHTRTLGGRQQNQRQPARSITSPTASDYAPTIIPQQIKPVTTPFGEEQTWSTALPSTWLLQFLVLGPVPVILVGQILLFLTTALHQTPADGNSVLPILLSLVVLSIITLLPVTPFIHRFNFRVPLILFLIALGTGVFVFLSFPFSETARLKVYFLQRLDLDTGITTTSLTGLHGYVKDIVQTLPSAQGERVACQASPSPSKAELTECVWPGLAPSLVPLDDHPALPPPQRYNKWLHLSTAARNATAPNHGAARLELSGANSRACKLLFTAPVHAFHVHGAAENWTAPAPGAHGTQEIRLWSREWDVPFVVDVEWAHDDDNGTAKRVGREGQAVCLWSDATQPDTIPALTEVKRFAPAWSVVSKMADGLVEGSRGFVLE